MNNVLDKKGNLKLDGYFKEFDFNLDRKLVRCSKERFKEWDFWQFQYQNYIFQITVAHALIFDNYYIGVFDILTNKRYQTSLLKLSHKNSLDLIHNPRRDFDKHYIFNKDNFDLYLRRTDDDIKIEFSGKDDKKNDFIVKMYFKSNKNTLMNIIHPFKESKKMFYLNTKENFYNIELNLDVNDIHIHTTKAIGVLDFGRGYWPYNNEWYWGNCGFYLNDNYIGWDLGYGFGISKDTENIIYINDESIKLDKIISTIDINDYMKPYTIKDDKGIINLEVTPIYDNYSSNKFLWINKWCHQIFLKTKGSIRYQNKVYEFNDVISFFEHEVNHW